MKPLVVLILALISGIALAASPTAAEILAQSKVASGGDLWNGVHSLHIKGKMFKGGLTGTADKSVDIVGGRSVSHYVIGPYAGGQGYDGRTGWIAAPSGEVSPEDTPDARQADVSEAYIAARGYWFPQRWPAQIELLGPRRDGENHYEVLKITPKGGDPFELWINSMTHLVDRTVMMTPTGNETRTYNEYLSVRGVQIPFHQWISNSQNGFTIYQYDAASVNLPLSGSEFSMPAQSLSDFAFLGGGSQATIPFKLVNNHVYLPANVNGRPLQLRLDTAGQNVLTQNAAAQLDVKSAGNFKGKTTSGHTLALSVAQLPSLNLGNAVVLSNQLFRVTRLPGLNDVDGTNFDGLVGYELFKRFVVQINYAFRKMTLMLPKDFSPANMGTPVPFTLTSGRIPTVSGTIDGIPGQFAVDTGSHGALSLSPAFVQTHKLLTRYQTTPEAVIGWGVGGGEMGHVARGGSLALGSVTVHGPVVALAGPNAAGGLDKGLDGVIGGEILQRFTVTFDYANQRLYLKPNQNYGAPMNYDRAGLWVNQQGKDFVVESVMPDGPAAQAGIKPGDLITGVNDKLASTLTLDDLRASLCDGAPGSSVKLAVAHGGASHWVMLVLRELIPAQGGPRKAA